MPTDTTAMNYPSLEAGQCPFPIFDRIRAEGGVHQVPGENEFLVAGHALVHEALRKPEVFSSSTPLNAEAQPGWEMSVFSSDPPDHTVKREIAYRSFTPGRLKAYTPMIQGVIDDLIDDFIDDGRAEFVSQFAKLMSSRVMFNILDMDADEAAWIVDTTFEGAGVRYLPKELRDAQDRDGVRIAEHMRRIVEDRVDNLGDDAISDLIRGHRERLGEDNLDYLSAESAVVLLGGVHTSAHLTGSALQLLLQHPDQMRQVLDDHSLIPRMLEESLRHQSVQQFMSRWTTADTELGGVAMPAGSLVLILFAAANRDEQTFDAPEQFDITRANVKKHLGFGFGPHFCLGAPLARLEGEISFATLFTRLANIRLAEGKNDFKPIRSAFIRGPRELHIEFDKA